MGIQGTFKLLMNSGQARRQRLKYVITLFAMITVQGGMSARTGGGILHGVYRQIGGQPTLCAAPFMQPITWQVQRWDVGRQ